MRDRYVFITSVLFCLSFNKTMTDRFGSSTERCGNTALFVFDILMLPITIIRIALIYLWGSRYSIDGFRFLDVVMHANEPYFNSSGEEIVTIDDDVRVVIRDDSRFFPADIKHNPHVDNLITVSMPNVRPPSGANKSRSIWDTQDSIGSPNSANSADDEPTDSTTSTGTDDMSSGTDSNDSTDDTSTNEDSDDSSNDGLDCDDLIMVDDTEERRNIKKKRKEQNADVLLEEVTNAINGIDPRINLASDNSSDEESVEVDADQNVPQDVAGADVNADVDTDTDKDGDPDSSDDIERLLQRARERNRAYSIDSTESVGTKKTIVRANTRDGENTEDTTDPIIDTLNSAFE